MCAVKIDGITSDLLRLQHKITETDWKGVSFPLKSVNRGVDELGHDKKGQWTSFLQWTLYERSVENNTAY